MTVAEKQALLAKWCLQNDQRFTMRTILTSSFSMAFDECGLSSRRSVKTIINRATKIAVKVISYYPKKTIFHAIPWNISSSLISYTPAPKTKKFSLFARKSPIKMNRSIKDLSKKEIIRCLRERVIRPRYESQAGFIAPRVFR